jgi:hypothetical protein
MRAGEQAIFFNNAAAGSTTAYILGGKYLLVFAGTGTGTVDLFATALDGSQTAKVATQITATAGSQVLDLPPGTYKATIATFTANYLTLTRIPEE